MPDVTKNEALIAILKLAGFQQITLRVVPKLFLFTDGICQSELEFSRTYFDETNLAALQDLMRDKILPAIKEHVGKKVYVNANGISIIPRTLN
ncbi:MAG: hypothetical protein H8K09_00065 [Nitrospira sp.]|jgi:hypothetical protein|nr:hypothetical protein [Nitrospira sp.]